MDRDTKLDRIGHLINAFRDEYEAEDFSDEYWEQTGRDTICYTVSLY